MSTQLDDAVLLVKAAGLANTAHAGMTRDDNKTPFVTHCFREAEVVARLLDDVPPSVLDPYDSVQVVAAAILHDVLEDCEPKYAEEIKYLNKGVYELCQMLCNPSCGYPNFDRQEKKMMDCEHYKHVHLAAVLCKFCDRQDNLYDIECWKEKRKRRYVEESWELLAVLAERIYKSKIKNLGIKLQNRIALAIDFTEGLMGERESTCSKCDLVRHSVEIPKFYHPNFGLVQNARFIYCEICDHLDCSPEELQRWQAEGER